MSNTVRESLLEVVEMVVALGENQWRTAVADRLRDVVADASSTSAIIDKLLIQSLELETPVSVRRSGRLERRRLHERVVLERTGSRLRPGVHAVPHGATLHEDDRVVPVLARNGRGQPQHEARFRLASHLLEAVR